MDKIDKITLSYLCCSLLCSTSFSSSGWGQSNKPPTIERRKPSTTVINKTGNRTQLFIQAVAEPPPPPPPLFIRAVAEQLRPQPQPQRLLDMRLRWAQGLIDVCDTAFQGLDAAVIFQNPNPSIPILILSLPSKIYQDAIVGSLGVFAAEKQKKTNCDFKVGIGHAASRHLLNPDQPNDIFYSSVMFEFLPFNVQWYIKNELGFEPETYQWKSAVLFAFLGSCLFCYDYEKFTRIKENTDKNSYHVDCYVKFPRIIGKSGTLETKYVRVCFAIDLTAYDLFFTTAYPISKIKFLKAQNGLDPKDKLYPGTLSAPVSDGEDDRAEESDLSFSLSDPRTLSAPVSEAEDDWWEELLASQTPPFSFLLPPMAKDEEDEKIEELLIDFYGKK